MRKVRRVRNHRIQTRLGKEPRPASFIRMQEAAKKDVTLSFHTLTHQMRVELFEVAYHRLKGSKACGLDGISKKEYGENMEKNLKDLEDRIHQGTYTPKPSREILIPKGKGKTRPLAISNIEDKIIQMSVKMILEALYEPKFLQSSLGFRPKRGAHIAIRTVYNLLMRNERPYVVECDIEKYFDRIDHKRLMAYLKRRISDRRFLKLIEKLLRTEVKEVSGKIQRNIQGTPQGSIVSPVLANIYLHYVLDKWFNKNYSSHFQREVRYADDVFFCFRKPKDAQSFYRSLKSRLKEAGLSRNEEKSRIVDFRKYSGETFNLLGFTFYWGKDRKRQILLKLKTESERFRRSILEFQEWIKANRNRKCLSKLWEKAAQKLLGHYAYFSVTWNKRTGSFYTICVKLMYKWLNRRSQKRSFTWEKFLDKLRVKPLPKPWKVEALNIAQGTLYGII